MTRLSRIHEESEHPHQETQDEPTRPGEVGRTCELDPVVVEGGIATKDLGEDAITEIVEELCDDYPESRCENRCDDERGADLRHDSGGFCGGLGCHSCEMLNQNLRAERGLS